MKNFLNKLKNNEAIKFYPLNFENNSKWFVYCVASNTARTNESFIQVTLFVNDKPYGHFLTDIDNLIADVSINPYSYSDECLKTSLVDEFLIDVAELKELPSTSINVRGEEINKLYLKYQKDLLNLNSDKLDYLNNIFKLYIENTNEKLENVELLIKQITYSQ